MITERDWKQAEWAGIVFLVVGFLTLVYLLVRFEQIFVVAYSVWRWLWG